MIIIQHSAPQNFEKRMGNRMTWMKFTNKYDFLLWQSDKNALFLSFNKWYFFFFFKNIFRLRKIKAIFVIGVPVIVNGSQMKIDKDAQMKLELEYALYGDILQVIGSLLSGLMVC
jgi:hypothetical protein